MEIRNLSFTKYLSSDENNFYYLEKFFKTNNTILELFIEYDKISYIDDYSKFFYLFSRREVFLDQFEDYLSQYILHENSVFYLLLFFHVKFSDALKCFQYELNDIEDSIIYIDLYMQIEMFKIIERILFNYPFIANSLIDEYPIPKYDEPILINNSNLLLISVFIFEPYRLFEIIMKDVQLYQSPASNDDLKEIDLFYIKETIFDLEDVIHEKTNRRYSKFMNPHLFMSNRAKFRSNDQFDKFIEENDLLKPYKINSSIIFCDDQIFFGFRENSKYHLDFKHFFSFDFFRDTYLDKTVGKMNQKKANYLKVEDIVKKQNDFQASSKLKAILTVNIDIKSASNIIDKYIDAKLSGDVNLKEDLKTLLHFVNTSEYIEVPNVRGISLETVKYLLSFFITMRNETKIFDFSNIEELIYLFLYISSNIDSIDNTQLRKVHRLQKFKMHKDLVKELKSLVPISYLNDF